MSRSRVWLSLQTHLPVNTTQIRTQTRPPSATSRTQFAGRHVDPMSLPRKANHSWHFLHPIPTLPGRDFWWLGFSVKSMRRAAEGGGLRFVCAPGFVRFRTLPPPNLTFTSSFTAPKVRWHILELPACPNQ